MFRKSYNQNVHFKFVESLNCVWEMDWPLSISTIIDTSKNFEIPFSWLFFVFLFPYRLIRNLNIVKLIQIRYDNFGGKTMFAKSIWSNFWIWLSILIDILWICFLFLKLFLAIEIHIEQVRSLVTLCEIWVFRIHSKSVINFILTQWKVNIFTRMFWSSDVSRCFFCLKIHQPGS